MINIKTEPKIKLIPKNRSTLKKFPRTPKITRIM